MTVVTWWCWDKLSCGKDTWPCAREGSAQTCPECPLPSPGCSQRCSTHAGRGAFPNLGAPKALLAGSCWQWSLGGSPPAFVWSTAFKPKLCCSPQPGMLDVLEYGIDRVTDPNENKVNQVRQAWVFLTHLLNLSGRTQKMSLGLSFFWALQAECVSSALRA